jgi:hypothetical protein
MNRNSRCLIVVSKRPEPGQVKTRLAVDVGEFRAAALYEAFLRDTIVTAQALADTDLLISFTPPEAREYYGELAPHARLVEQPDGDLGRRLYHAFEIAFGLGYQQAVVIGSDSPHLTVERLEEAFAVTRGETAVIGPSDDGGYYLLGLSNPEPVLFGGIDWGSERVFAQTQRRANSAGLRLSVLSAEFDVDTLQDLEKLEALLQDRSDQRCPYTRSELMALTVRSA